MRNVGTISPAKAAKLLGLHYNTVRADCQRSIAGDPRARLRGVTRALNGYFRIPLAEVHRLKAQQA